MTMLRQRFQSHAAGSELRARCLYALALIVVAVLMLLEVVILPGQLVRRHWAEASPVMQRSAAVHQNALSLQQHLTPPADPFAAERDQIRLANTALEESVAVRNLAWNSLCKKVHATFGFDLPGTSDVSLEENIILGKVVWKELTARQSWANIKTLSDSESSSRQEITALIQAAPRMPLASTEQVAQIVERLNALTERARRETTAYRDAIKDVEHLGILIEAERFDQHLGH